MLANSISNAVVKLFSEFLGRGPTKARTVVSRDLISVVLEDTLTRAERHLIEGGQGDTVVEMRRAMQGTMREPLIDAVEWLAERRVIAFTSQQQLQGDFTVENFVLEPLPHESDNNSRDGHHGYPR